jgi:hypothetical protein
MVLYVAPWKRASKGSQEDALAGVIPTPWSRLTIHACGPIDGDESTGSSNHFPLLRFFEEAQKRSESRMRECEQRNLDLGAVVTQLMASLQTVYLYLYVQAVILAFASIFKYVQERRHTWIRHMYCHLQVVLKIRINTSFMRFDRSTVSIMPQVQENNLQCRPNHTHVYIDLGILYKLLINIMTIYIFIYFARRCGRFYIKKFLYYIFICT